MNKRSFTLLELVVVIIIIGILVTFAAPQYIMAVQKAKAAKAKQHISLIHQAEKMYYQEQGQYSPLVGSSADYSELNKYSDLSEVANDQDWYYTTDTTGNLKITAYSKKNTGNYVGFDTGTGLWDSNIPGIAGDSGATANATVNGT